MKQNNHNTSVNSNFEEEGIGMIWSSCLIVFAL